MRRVCALGIAVGAGALLASGCEGIRVGFRKPSMTTIASDTIHLLVTAGAAPAPPGPEEPSDGPDECGAETGEGPEPIPGPQEPAEF
jgi:hypothetical protein